MCTICLPFCILMWQKDTNLFNLSLQKQHYTSTFFFFNITRKCLYSMVFTANTKCSYWTYLQYVHFQLLVFPGNIINVFIFKFGQYKALGYGCGKIGILVENLCWLCAQDGTHWLFQYLIKNHDLSLTLFTQTFVSLPLPCNILIT